MSWVANLMLQVDRQDRDVVEAVSAWPRGTWGPARWRRLYMYRDGAWHQYAPPPPVDADDQHAW